MSFDIRLLCAVQLTGAVNGNGVAHPDGSIARLSSNEKFQ